MSKAWADDYKDWQELYSERPLFYGYETGKNGIWKPISDYYTRMVGVLLKDNKPVGLVAEYYDEYYLKFQQHRYWFKNGRYETFHTQPWLKPANSAAKLFDSWVKTGQFSDKLPPKQTVMTSQQEEISAPVLLGSIAIIITFLGFLAFL